MSITNQLGIIASAGRGEPDMFKVLATEEIAFNVADLSDVTQNFTMSFDDVSQLEFHIKEESTTNSNAVDYNRVSMIRPGTTSTTVIRVPNSADGARNQTIIYNASAKTIRVITGTTATFRGSIQIVKYDRTVVQTITLLNNATTTEQTMPSTVTNLSKCFLQPGNSYCDGVYIQGPLNTANTYSWHIVYYASGSSRGGIKITSNSKYQCSHTVVGTFYLIEFE